MATSLHAAIHSDWQSSQVLDCQNRNGTSELVITIDFNRLSRVIIERVVVRELYRSNGQSEAEQIKLQLNGNDGW